MTAVAYPTPPRPAPPSLVSFALGLFSVFGGPVAWYVQLCGGFALATQSCVVDGVHAAEPLTHMQWAGPAMTGLMAVSFLVSLGSFGVAWQGFKRAETRTPGLGRSRFMAIWGMLLASVFALATAMTAVGFWMIPRCTG
jgi:hypothetical protein